MYRNFAADTDSYKYSHFDQTPEEVKYVTSYGSARSDERWTRHMVFSYQAYIKKLMSSPLTMRQLLRTEKKILAHMGVFPSAQLRKMVNQYWGLPPIRIQVLPEGLMVPRGVPQYQITTLDPDLPFIGQFIEAAMVRAAWYPGSVGTESWHIKQDIRGMLEKTCDNVADVLPFMLHDFGARGADSEEAAALGGMAHLVNFMGTDTVPALFAAEDYYGEDLAGFSIPAMEHYTVTSWGREREADAYANMIEKFGGPGKMYACVSDTYDIYNAVDNIWGKQLKQKVLDKGGRVVIRPDSGDPVSVVLYVVKSLLNSYGFSRNSKGYDVLNPAVRVIQGDGIDRDAIHHIQNTLEIHKISCENVNFGMGGALLNGACRDDGGYAQKASAVSADGIDWTGIAKDPVTSRQKASMKGRQMVIRDEDGQYHVGPEGSLKGENLLQTVYENFGTPTLVRDMKFSEVRANSLL